MRPSTLLAALTCGLIAAPASAQARLMVGAGLSNPSGSFSDAVDSGLHTRVGIELGIPVFPVTVRGEGELHRFSEAVGAGDTHLLAGTVSGVLSLGGIGLTPYVIGGFGTYRTTTSVSDAVSHRGYHGGFGASIGALGFGGYAEVRLVNIRGDSEDTRYIPVTVGFRF